MHVCVFVCIYKQNFRRKKVQRNWRMYALIIVRKNVCLYINTTRSGLIEVVCVLFFSSFGGLNALCGYTRSRTRRTDALKYIFREAASHNKMKRAVKCRLPFFLPIPLWSTPRWLVPMERIKILSRVHVSLAYFWRWSSLFYCVTLSPVSENIS